MGVTSLIARRFGSKAVGEAVDHLAVRLADATRVVIDTVLQRRGAALAADADVFRLAHRSLDAAALERALIRERARQGLRTGLASGVPSIVVGPGTAMEVAAAIIDGAALTYAQVALVLQIGHLRGLDVRQVEARRFDVLLVLGLEAGVVTRDGDAFMFDGHRLDPADASDELVGRVTRELGDRIVTKVAKRRAGGMVGRLVPFGVGVAVAGVEDYRALTSVGRAARRYFDHRGPST